MKEFITKNNKKKVVINVASMREVRELKKQLLLAIKDQPIKMNVTGTVENILDKEINLDSLLDFLKNAIINLETSDDLNAAIFVCLGHCTYNSVHIINEDLFDNVCPDARADYYEIIMEVVKENLNPFIQSLRTEFATIMQTLPTFQKLSSTATD